jgi:hypothetical protein
MTGIWNCTRTLAVCTDVVDAKFVDFTAVFTAVNSSLVRWIISFAAGVGLSSKRGS